MSRTYGGLPIALALLVVVGGAGVGFVAADRVPRSGDGPPSDGGSPHADGGGSGRPIDASGLEVDALEAARVAQDETDAKPLAVELISHNGSPVFEVLTLTEEGDLTAVLVDASQPEVVRTVDLGPVNTSLVEDTGAGEDFSDLRSAVDAIEAAREAVSEDAVPIGVAFEPHAGFLFQVVTFARPVGERTRSTHVVVDATVGPVIGVLPSGGDRGPGHPPRQDGAPSSGNQTTSRPN